MRCRAQLERQARAASHAPARSSWTVPIWQPVILVLGVVYLTEVLVQALRVYGLR
jgi:hypothetical protein